MSATAEAFTVLVVDDDDAIRGLARLALEEIGGMRVLEADNGMAAFSMATCERVDAILLDAVMPGLDGVSTLRLLRASPRTVGIPVVFLTARRVWGDAEELRRLGVAGQIPKPFDPGNLAHDLGEIVGNGRDD